MTGPNDFLLLTENLSCRKIEPHLILPPNRPVASDEARGLSPNNIVSPLIYGYTPGNNKKLV